ncbi:hypothetical protein A0U90_00380 [Kozakia baliensis]|nr:hypothetical protein A0U90_00380 [Kozakia baliensis]
MAFFLPNDGQLLYGAASYNASAPCRTIAQRSEGPPLPLIHAIICSKSFSAEHLLLVRGY